MLTFIIINMQLIEILVLCNHNKLAVVRSSFGALGTNPLTHALACARARAVDVKRSHALFYRRGSGNYICVQQFARPDLPSQQPLQQAMATPSLGNFFVKYCTWCYKGVDFAIRTYYSVVYSRPHCCFFYRA